ncbi:MAG: hypothetical protein H6978_04325 [Gammaproteobacteria bacterium]|nr:hypothetical protein [Gammaproteobacteria bacterium]
MQPTRLDNDNFFSNTATVVVYLEGVRRIANDISLAAANAKAVAARAGARAAGFMPITNFIDEMGRETRHLVDKVNRDAQLVVRKMLAEQNLHDGIQRMQRGVDALSKPSPYLDGVLSSMRDEYQLARDSASRDVANLCEQLDEISDHARAAHMISTRSRVEATIAGEHRTTLESIADTVENAAERIHDTVMKCRTLLREIH